MSRVLWVTVFLLQYIAMIASYGGEVVAATATTSFLFLLALNPYWVKYIPGFINLRDNLTLYLIIVVSPFFYSLWKFFCVQKEDNFDVIVLWGNGAASIPFDNLELYCLANLLFSAFCLVFYFKTRQ